MFDVIEKLLILQDRDRKIQALQTELDHVEPQRTAMQEKDKSSRDALEVAKRRVNELESRRKQLDLEVETKKSQIERYANQQLQTRKNEEYKALAHEIDTTREAIRQIEDKEIELMEQGEEAQKTVIAATAAAAAARKVVDSEIAALGTREANLRRELEELEVNRDELAAVVESQALARYERLVFSKGRNVVVGVHKGMCGGCHMKLPAQVLVECKAQDQIVTCTNCGRILYFTRDMSLVAED
jgi:predicted  nucleic acid-binding Zn-ribbon protein